MKRLIAVLILFIFCLASPLAALASTRHAGPPSITPPPELPAAPPSTGQSCDGEPQECGTMGDPDELGGGFRGGALPPSFAGASVSSTRLVDLWIMLMMMTR